MPAPARPRWARRVWARRAWARPVVGLAVLAALVAALGAGPFLAGLRLIDAPALAAALAIGLVTTVSCAWRWWLVAGGLGVRLPMLAAVAHCYRAVFLNSTLPGGMLGDVHRAVRHGRDAGDLARGVRAVVWERAAGQVVQVVIAVAVLAAFPSPVRRHLPVLVAVLAVAALALVLAARAVPRAGTSRWARAARTAIADVRCGLLARRTWAGVVTASALVFVGQLATFVVAARTAGADAPLSRLLPLTLLALLAMALPLNVGGFGPREGVAAWAFASAGLTAAQGVTTGTVYGALILVASLPGAAVLLVRRGARRAPGDCR
ncbi:lysylphosphatidylglycerol synthase domain-containing protein [Micromonospora sp. NBS 11-29]|uniref:lysylphosphatidylglycerol synthase domain-containing protein n=1 Tax=Micromonospora sp. NBS 11-29 TaxID=1960879 RepID=UPI0020CE8594|nr:lysylphosphatidylglycerol synthase domain-containing protein [Micromonospora sp. NBS 11-29]